MTLKLTPLLSNHRSHKGLLCKRPEIILTAFGEKMKKKEFFFPRKMLQDVLQQW
jgi:hypothetical protein